MVKGAKKFKLTSIKVLSCRSMSDERGRNFADRCSKMINSEVRPFSILLALKV